MSKQTEPGSVFAPSAGYAPGALPVWHADASLSAPVLKWCMKYGWPNCTTEGETMYENSHVADEFAAWREIIKNQEAGIWLLAGRIKRAREEVRMFEAELANDTILLRETRDNFEKRQEQEHNNQLTDGGKTDGR